MNSDVTALAENVYPGESIDCIIDDLLFQEVLGFCCCTYSTIRVVKHSELASPFEVTLRLL